MIKLFLNSSYKFRGIFDKKLANNFFFLNNLPNVIKVKKKSHDLSNCQLIIIDGVPCDGS